MRLDRQIDGHTALGNSEVMWTSPSYVSSFVVPNLFWLERAPAPYVFFFKGRYPCRWTADKTRHFQGQVW